MTLSNGNIFPVTGIWWGESTGGFPPQRLVMRNFNVFFDLRLNKRLRKQSRRRWFETPVHSLWRHCNVLCHAPSKYGEMTETVNIIWYLPEINQHAKVWFLCCSLAVLQSVQELLAQDRTQEAIMNLKLYVVIQYRQISLSINTLRPRQDGGHFPDDVFKCIFLNENAWISIKISLKFIPKGPINNIPALIQIMAWRRPGDKPLSEPMMIKLPTHICVTRPQWVTAPNPKT